MASDVDGAGIFLGGGKTGEISKTTESSVGLGVVSIVGPGALLGIGGSNVFVTDMSVGINNPNPVEEIIRQGADFNEREVTTPGVAVTTTADGTVTGMTTVGAIYSEVVVASQQVTTEGTPVQEITREVTAASAVEITADGNIDLLSRGVEATEFVDSFVFDPAFQRSYGQFFGTLGVQASTIELTSNNANIAYLQIGGGNLTTQNIPDSTTVFPSISVEYTQAEMVDLKALNGFVNGVITVAEQLNVLAQSIRLSIVAGNFEISSQVIEVITDAQDPEDISFVSREAGIVVGADQVTLSASGDVRVSAGIYAKELTSNAVSTSIKVYGGGNLVTVTNEENTDRDLGLLPSESVIINSTGDSASDSGSSIEVMSLAGSVTTLGTSDTVTMVNARGTAQQMALDLGEGDDTVLIRGLYSMQPATDFVFTGGENGVFILTVKDGDTASDVYTLSGVETVNIQNSISRDVDFTFLLTNGAYVLE